MTTEYVESSRNPGENDLTIGDAKDDSKMTGFDKLSKCAGEWIGHNRVQPSVGDPVDESLSRLTITSILKGTFLQLDQEWSWKGDPQYGSMLIGYVPEKEQATIHWVDTWHNGRRSMDLIGRFDAEDKLVANGHFPVESQLDWGWRIEIQTSGDDELSINMYCINPVNGKDEGWVWSTFVRKT
jgi:hypothetical protein